MSQTDEIIYGVTGQTVEMYPPEWAEGVPSSPTASVYESHDSNDDTAQFSPTVLVDSQNTVNTTFDAASGFSQSDKRKANLTATTNIAIGRMYLAENVVGQKELVKVTAIASNDYVLLQEPLKYDYAASTGTFKSIRLVFTVDSTWVATEDRVLTPDEASYRVIWAYTINSIARRHYTYLRLVRQPFKALITIYDIAAHIPDVALSEPESKFGRQARDTIAKAVDRVRVDLLTVSLRPDMIRDTEILKELQLRAAIYLSSLWHTPPGLDKDGWIERSMDDYRDLFGRVTAGTLKMAVDKSAEGAITTQKHTTMWLGR